MTAAGQAFQKAEEEEEEEEEEAAKVSAREVAMERAAVGRGEGLEVAAAGEEGVREVAETQAAAARLDRRPTLRSQVRTIGMPRQAA